MVDLLTRIKPISSDYGGDMSNIMQLTLFSGKLDTYFFQNFLHSLITTYLSGYPNKANIYNEVSM